MLDGLGDIVYSLHFVKGKGNSFLCYTISNNDTDENNNLAETFYGYTKLDLDDWAESLGELIAQ